MLKTEESCVVVSDSTITSKFVHRPPYTYSMKIKSLSQLKTLFSVNGYKSGSFSSGRYNCYTLLLRLVIYPKGNGFISMYVESDSKSLSSTVLAYLTFFVYNKKENKYFTIQDDEGKQFSALRPVWGLPQVLRLDTFNDPKNGYVFDGDECEFGVDVMVPHTNWEVVSFAHEPSNRKFTWTINKFSKLKNHCYVSDKFVVEGINWVIKLYPKGYTTSHSKWLSLYLHLADIELMKTDEEIYMTWDMRVLDPFGCNHVTRKSSGWHENHIRGYGWCEFVSLAELEEAYLDKQGSLTVEIEFEVISTIKYSS